MTGAEQLRLDDPESSCGTRREVVVGRNSRVWQRLSADLRVTERVGAAIGHRDVPAFAFGPGDRVWVFSYSRNEHENTALLKRLEDAGVSELVYVSSSSCRVTSETACYEYPRIKQRAETAALSHRAGKVLTIGLMYAAEGELPAGENIATRLSELAAFMLAPQWPQGQGRRKNLFRQVSRPFSGALERSLYRTYGRVIFSLRRYPCVLRPIDLLLRVLGMRWYGYVYLSNRLWISTPS